MKWAGIPRYFQAIFGPFHWASAVVHCSTVNDKLDCKQVSPKNGHPSANGMVLTDNGKTLLVNDIVEATTTIYDVDQTSKQLTVRKKVVRMDLPEDGSANRDVPEAGRSCGQHLRNSWR